VFRPNLVGKTHPEVERAIRLLQDEIVSLRGKLDKQTQTVVAPVSQPVAGGPLIGGVFAQPEIGTGSTDPSLEGVSISEGTVTQINTTAPITGGPITSTGTIAHANSGVGAASYTLSSITVNATGHVTAASSGSLDQDLVDIAALTPTNDDMMQRKAGAWTNRTLTQVKSDLAMGGLTGWTDGTTRTVAAASTQFTYLLDTNTGAFNATESNRQNVVPMDGTLSRLYVRTSSTQPADGALTLTLRVAGADTSVVIVIAANSVAGIFSDITHSASVTAGQLVGLKAVNASPGTASAGIFDVRLIFTRT
jgi:hypothetical protein